MSDMKCPVCGKDMVFIESDEGFDVFVCTSSKCKCLGYANESVWKYIDHTRKALKIAVDALEEYEDADSYDCDGNWCGLKYSTAHNALKQIMALEQKD